MNGLHTLTPAQLQAWQHDANDRVLRADELLVFLENRRWQNWAHDNTFRTQVTEYRRYWVEQIDVYAAELAARPVA